MLRLRSAPQSVQLCKPRPPQSGESYLSLGLRRGPLEGLPPAGSSRTKPSSRGPLASFGRIQEPILCGQPNGRSTLLRRQKETAGSSLCFLSIFGPFPEISPKHLRAGISALVTEQVRDCRESCHKNVNKINKWPDYDPAGYVSAPFSFSWRCIIKRDAQDAIKHFIISASMRSSVESFSTWRGAVHHFDFEQVKWTTFQE